MFVLSSIVMLDGPYILDPSKLFLETLLPVILAAIIGFLFSRVTVKKDRNSTYVKERISSLKYDFDAFYLSIGKLATFTKVYEHKCSEEKYLMTIEDFQTFQSYHLELTLRARSIIITSYELIEFTNNSEINSHLDSLIDNMNESADKVSKLSKIFFTDLGKLISDESLADLNNHRLKLLDENSEAFLQLIQELLKLL